MRLWGGRFEGETDAVMRRFSDSIAFDRRLYASDVRGSIAYAGALEDAGLLEAAERSRLVEGLEQVRAEFEAGTFQLAPGDEDIHTAVERRLGELIGPLAGKLHTGRSRNDQVATDLRLYLLEAIGPLREGVRELQAALVDQAEAHLGAILPGYTHLQQAQPLLFSHWLLSFFWKFQRDQGRLDDLQDRTLSTARRWPPPWALRASARTAWMPSATAILPSSSWPGRRCCRCT
jgi:argininosuccinate lyase